MSPPEAWRSAARGRRGRLHGPCRALSLGLGAPGAVSIPDPLSIRDGFSMLIPVCLAMRALAGLGMFGAASHIADTVARLIPMTPA